MLRIFKTLLLCCCLMYGCRIAPGKAEITLSLPQMPPAWENSGTTVYQIYLAENEEFLGVIRSGEEREFTVPKGEAVPLIGRPLIQGMVSVGAVFPRDLNSEGLLPLTWASGAVVEILKPFWDSSYPVSAVNISRLKESVSTAGSGNPWAVDMEVIREMLLLGMMDSRYIKAKKLVPELPPAIESILQEAGSAWICGNPLALYCDAEGYYSGGAFSEGIHYFFNSGTMERITLQIQHNEVLMKREDELFWNGLLSLPYQK